MTHTYIHALFDIAGWIKGSHAAEADVDLSETYSPLERKTEPYSLETYSLDQNMQLKRPFVR